VAEPAGDSRLGAYRRLVADVYELAARTRSSDEQLAGEEGQTAARWHLLGVLSDEPLSVAAAARRLGLARQSVQRVANDLLAEGLLASSPDPGDARAPRLRPTDRGTAVLGRLLDRSTRRQRAVLQRAGTSVGDVERADAVLRALLAASAALPAPSPPRRGTRSITARG
jgi:DNA-binding MarR family transcriptional regulator